ncbi:MAG TPA: vanadium-dependent haloperoxidase, partial [Lautropia sp.]|nr:vanadium-dependent haloperoxidase [Lautropia sp.]
GATLLSSGAAPAAGLVEPDAGSWKTWVLTSGSQLRPAAPPDERATAQELVEVKVAVEAASADATARDKISYWNIGYPGYRWQEIAIARQSKESTPVPHQTWLWHVLALLNVASHDATVATWDAKYAFKRHRPAEVDPSLIALVETPRSPSYPSEHAAVATASADVLAYLFPNDATMFSKQAKEASRSRIQAGVAFPTDVQAGEELGRKVAAAVIERAKNDGAKGSDLDFTGTIPTGPGYWTGTNPRLFTLGSWKPWVIKGPDEFRPPPPPAYDSPQRRAELDEIKNFKHTFQHRRAAFFWNAPEIIEWLNVANKKIFEYRWDDNPPRAAHAVALLMVAEIDVGIACFGAKYHYWVPRPTMLDPSIVPLIGVPNHPSYPAAHGCNDSAAEVVLTSLFPRDAATFQAMAREGSDSRLWAGIHYRSDIDAGIKIGEAVGRMVVKEGAIRDAGTR